MAKINLDEIDFKNMSSKERLIWFLNNLKIVGYYEPCVKGIIVEEKEIRKVFNIDPNKIKYDDELYQWIEPDFSMIVNDKDFFRKYPDIRDYYKVDYVIDYPPFTLVLKDFTDDFVKLYLEYKYGIKDSNTTTNNQINKIEIVEDKTEKKKVSFYINEDYSKLFEFNRNKTWTPLYDLARDQEVDYNRSFFNYINSNKDNPLYSNYKFNITKILKMDGEYIKPNIPIVLKSQKTITTRKNKKSKA